MVRELMELHKEELSTSARSKTDPNRAGKVL